jgi:signal transduction histidine kinase/ligand-binding sensor domain-containing protein
MGHHASSATQEFAGELRLMPMRALRAVLIGTALLSPVRPAQAQSYEFKQYGADAGVDPATALAFDSDGQLLIGTNDGLLRLDGRDVNRVALTGSHLGVLRLASGTGGVTWVLTQPARLFTIWTNGAVREIVLPAPLSAALTQARSSRRMRVDPAGRLWISDPDAGLWSFDPGTSLWRKSTGVSDPAPLDFFFTGADTVWLAMRDRVGTAIIRDGRITQPNWRWKLRDVVFLRPNGAQLAWIGTGHGVFIIERNGSLHQVLGYDFAAWWHNEPATDSAGRILLVGGYGDGALSLFELAADGAMQLSARSRPLLADHVLRQELFDPEHGFWVAHDGGVSQLDQDYLASYVVRSGDGIAETIRDLQEDPFGRGLWISTMGGVYRLKDGRIERISAKTRRPASVTAISRDRSLSWTEDLNRGFALVDGQRVAHTDRTDNVLLETADGLHYSDTPAGLVRRSPDNRDSPVVISRHHITPALAAQGSGGRIWLSAQFRGIDTIDEDSLASECVGCAPVSIRAIRTGLKAVDMRAMRADADGRVWLASFGGLVCLWRDAGGEWNSRNFGWRDGLLSEDVLSVAPASGGRLWVGTARGLQEFSITSVVGSEPTLRSTLEFRARDGLDGENVTGVVEDARGDVWFSSAPGLLYRLDDRAIPLLRSPTVRIARVEVNGIVEPFGDAALRVHAGTGAVIVQLSARTLHRSAQVRVQYRLEPDDKTWTDLGADRAVRLDALSPGNHMLAARAVRPGENPGPVTRLAIAAELPFYRMWWFPLLIATALTALAIRLYRMRMERRLALERLRARIATDLHDDIGSGLTQISLYGELIRRESDDRVAAWANAMGAQARQLSESMRDLVWAIDPERESWNALELRMKDWGAELLALTPVALDMSGTVDDGMVPLSADVRRNILLVFKEALHNAVRHAACTRVEVRWRISAASLRLIIRDDGTGFDERCATRGNGLHNIARRAKEIGASVRIESSMGTGTQIEIDLSLRRHPGLPVSASVPPYPDM